MNDLILELRSAPNRLTNLGENAERLMLEAASMIERLQMPVPMRLRCPSCHAIHVDEGEFASKPHHTHACQECGEVWRPAIVPTIGVRFLPGFKNI